MEDILSDENLFLLQSQKKLKYYNLQESEFINSLRENFLSFLENLPLDQYVFNINIQNTM